MLGIGVLTRADGVIDNRAVGAKAGNGGADAGGIIFPTGQEFPPAGSMVVGREPYTKRATVPRDQVANSAAPFFGQLRGVRGREECPAG